MLTERFTKIVNARYSLYPVQALTLLDQACQRAMRSRSVPPPGVDIATRIHPSFFSRFELSPAQSAKWS